MEHPDRMTREERIAVRCENISNITLFTYLGTAIVYFANMELADCISTRQTFLTALAFVGGLAVVTFLLIMDDWSEIHEAFGVLIGMAAYTIFIYWETRRGIGIVFACIALAVVLLSPIPYFVYGKRKGRSVISYSFSRIIDSFALSRLVLAVLAIVVCLLLPISYGIKVNQLKTSTPDSSFVTAYLADGGYSDELGTGDYQAKKVYGDEYRLSNNLDRIKPVISEEEWDALDLKERQDTVVAIVECEARYLGIPFKIEVVFSDDLDYETKGYYAHTMHLICFNNQSLQEDGNMEALNTALHEVRHAYQYSIVEVYAKLSPEERALFCFDGVEEWYEEIITYVDGYDDYDAYLSQSLEEDSRKYASKESQSYINEINQLLKENSIE